ncbi:MAG: hypothetical protein RLZZ129_1353 [Verrucomicrobiota bacterium]|jgi:uncharacterized protein YdbL (DUF1318 family)
MMKTPLVRFLFAVLLLLLAAPAGRAEDVAAVRERMAARLPQIDSLKAAGALGENNRGRLETREGTDGANIAAEENRDREIVYAELARRTGTTAETVARARARQIAATSAPGVWLQRENGEWYRK